MTNKRFEMYEYRKVLVRMRMGESNRAISEAGLMGRKKAQKLRDTAQANGWLEPLNFLLDNMQLATVLNVTVHIPSSAIPSVLPYAETVEKWIEDGVQGTTIHQKLVNSHGFTGSYWTVNRYIKSVIEQQPGKVSTVMEFDPGDAAQVDFGTGPLIVDTRTGEMRKTWIFIMTLAWSRHMYAEFIWDQSVATWLSCHRRAFEWFSGVPKRVIIDNPKCAITKSCYHDPDVQRAYAECAEGYGFFMRHVLCAIHRKKPVLSLT